MLSTLCRVEETTMYRWEHVDMAAGEWFPPKANLNDNVAYLAIYLSSFALKRFVELSEAQERCNCRIASPRARVEHVFAGVAQLGGKTLRSIGLARATLHLNWKAATYNLRRFVYLKEARVVAF